MGEHIVVDDHMNDGNCKGKVNDEHIRGLGFCGAFLLLTSGIGNKGHSSHKSSAIPCLRPSVHSSVVECLLMVW